MGSVTLLIYIGDWRGPKESEFRDEFTAKQAQIDTKNSEQLKNKLRKHNFQVGDSAAKTAHSVYEAAYVAHPIDQFNAPNSEELKKKVVELRNTNLVLGQDPAHNMSTMRADYSKKEGGPIKLNRANLQKTHFLLGEEPMNLTSMNRTDFKAPRTDPNMSRDDEKRALIADLRSRDHLPRTSFRLWTS